jgi:YesN/AraC family two-component response regulator
MSLPVLAAQFNTNTKYLSNIINEYKGKNFNNYINGLRINYIMKLLYEKPEYRGYKTSYLAECCGFSSRIVFTTVFKKETGITPSYFINTLKNEEKTI